MNIAEFLSVLYRVFLTSAIRSVIFYRNLCGVVFVVVVVVLFFSVTRKSEEPCDFTVNLSSPYRMWVAAMITPRF